MRLLERGKIVGMRTGSSILVIGGAGYIGSHTCKALAQAGLKPVVFDNLSTGHRSAVKWGPLIEGDLLDRQALARLMDEIRPAAVLHFAAVSHVEGSHGDPAFYYHNNVEGSLNLLAAMRAHAIDKLVFASTSAVYGNGEGAPIHESATISPISAYGRSKAMIEAVLVDYERAYGLRSISLRYANAAGADPEGDVGEMHDPETHLVPRALMAAFGQQSALTVFGEDYPTADGTCVRDFVHVSDLADAHVEALRQLLAGRDGGAFNLGTGHGHSVREVLDCVAATTGHPVPSELGPRRPGDPARLVLCPKQAASRLGFAPHRSSLPNIVETAAAWLAKMAKAA